QVEVGRGPVFAQRYHPPQGRDCKIYVIGGQIFGVKKVFPRRTEEEKLGEPFTLTPELSDLGRRCGRAFEIELYGVDVIESDGKAYVVDMDSIPGTRASRMRPFSWRATFTTRRSAPSKVGRHRVESEGIRDTFTDEEGGITHVNRSTIYNEVTSS